MAKTIDRGGVATTADDAPREAVPEPGDGCPWCPDGILELHALEGMVYDLVECDRCHYKYHRLKMPEGQDRTYAWAKRHVDLAESIADPAQAALF